MNLATRILGVAIFVSVVAGATYGAFQAFGEDPQFSSVELEEPARNPNLLAGQRVPISIGAQNTGNTDVNFTLASDTEGFDLQTRPSVQSVKADNSTRVQALLSAQEDLEGQYNVTVVAFDNGTSDRLSTVSFNVTVTTPTPPEMSLTPVLPAVIPGGNATLEVQLRNTVAATQRVNLTVLDGAGSVQPAQVPLRPNGTGTATVNAAVPSDASGAFEVTVEASNEADRTATATSSIQVVPDGEVFVQPVQTSFDVRPGNRYSIPVTIVSNADVSGDVTASGADVVETNLTSIQPRSSTGGFVTLEVPEGAPGQLQQSADIDVAGLNKTVTATVSTTPSGESPGEGQQATVEYVGRVSSGEVFGTSLPAVAQGPYPKHESFQGGQAVEPLTVRMDGGQRQSAPSGVVSAVRNMTVGETQTITLSPEDAFGPERRTEELPATTELQRSRSVQKLLEDLPRQRLPPEFDIANKTEGDIIDFETTAGDVPITLQFKLIEKTEQRVTLERVAEIGDKITFFPVWPNATEVTDINETHITYTTTPPDSASEEPFTWDVNPRGHKAQWENATLVSTVNETEIELIHEPEEGLEYQASSGRFGQPRPYRVEDVTSETITVSTPNQNPLGGQTVTYTLTITDVSEAEQQRRRLPIGGG